MRKTLKNQDMLTEQKQTAVLFTRIENLITFVSKQLAGDFYDHFLAQHTQKHGY